MDAHWIEDGQDQNFTPSPTAYETSLAVRQFCKLVRGERSVQKPSHGFRVEELRTDERYCLICFGVRWFDVIYGCQGSGVRGQVSVCRCCGAMEAR